MDTCSLCEQITMVRVRSGGRRFGSGRKRTGSVLGDGRLETVYTLENGEDALSIQEAELSISGAWCIRTDILATRQYREHV